MKMWKLSHFPNFTTQINYNSSKSNNLNSIQMNVAFNLNREQHTPNVNRICLWQQYCSKHSLLEAIVEYSAFTLPLNTYEKIVWKIWIKWPWKVLLAEKLIMLPVISCLKQACTNKLQWYKWTMHSVLYTQTREQQRETCHRFHFKSYGTFLFNFSTNECWFVFCCFFHTQKNAFLCKQ